MTPDRKRALSGPESSGGGSSTAGSVTTPSHDVPAGSSLTPVPSFYVALSGSRSLTDEDAVSEAWGRAFRRLQKKRLTDIHPWDWKWVHGGAKDGVDDWFARHSVKYRQFIGRCLIIRPDYKAFHPKRAPLERNTQIVEWANALIAIWDGRSGGTLDTIKKAADKGIPIVVEIVT